jgi:hypothetical protein
MLGAAGAVVSDPEEAVPPGNPCGEEPLVRRTISHPLSFGAKNSTLNAAGRRNKFLFAADGRHIYRK